MLKKAVLDLLPQASRRRIEALGDALRLVSEIRDPRVLRALGPSGVRGLLLQRGKAGGPTRMPARHAAFFDWSYPHENAEMQALYRRAKRAQWDGESLPWSTSVDPLDPAVKLLPDDFVAFDVLARAGVPMGPRERQKLLHEIISWMMSQFLHGEQGALHAAAQVTEAIEVFDGKFYGATQVMDEARHVEVFQRYVHEKLENPYPVNDDLFVVIDSLMTDGRWDMKFLGMQIMVEGLALGAFGTLYKQTREPLLRELLRRVIRDEARHVHYGVLALRHHFREVLDERDRREREEWAFEVALLMRDRFMVHEVYDRHFAGRIDRATWHAFVGASKGMQHFRRVMFTRLVPNLREIGLVTPRILPRYESAGLGEFVKGRAADAMTSEELVGELDAAAQ